MEWPEKVNRLIIPMVVLSAPLKGLERVVSESNEKYSIVGVVIDGLGYAFVKLSEFCLSYSLIW